MSYRLSNQKDYRKTFHMNNQNWFGILELAQAYGWNPMGTAQPNGFELAGFGVFWQGDYWSAEGGLVLFEDALNMADALEIAFLEHNPVRLPSLHEFYSTSNPRDANGSRASIGAILLMIDFCQHGAFTIEKV